MKIFIGSPSKIDGHGARLAEVRLDVEHGWSGVYRFNSEGMSPEQVLVKVAEIREYHRKKCTRLDGFVSLRGIEITSVKRVFRIVDCTAWERGDGVELYVDVREDGKRVDGFPVIKRFATIDDVPDNGAIVALARAILADRVSTDAAHADFVAQTLALLGPGG